MAPGLPPPSPVSPPVSTPDFSNGGHSTSSVPLKKAPRGNSVKQYHGLDSLQGVVFYQMLEVTDEYGTKHCFDVRDKTQGALVYYEDLDDGDRSEAYCNLVHCYALPDNNYLWVEHGYYDDR
ncbi:hypothetical protein ABBQ32_005567 [Trebouxia sp. C0010 RCD-2024]